MGVSGPGTEATRTKRGAKKEKAPETKLKWVIGPHCRADLIGYSGTNVTGGQFIAQIYASGSREGTLDGERLQSIVIGAPIGVRITLCASADETTWMDAPWRTIRIQEGTTYRTTDGTPAVRVPDLEWLDNHEARRANENAQQSYPYAKNFEEGKGWTFGRVGPLKNRVAMIRVEHESRPIGSDKPAEAKAVEPEPTPEAEPAATAPKKSKAKKTV